MGLKAKEQEEGKGRKEEREGEREGGERKRGREGGSEKGKDGGRKGRKEGERDKGGGRTDRLKEIVITNSGAYVWINDQTEQKG